MISASIVSSASDTLRPPSSQGFAISSLVAADNLPSAMRPHASIWTRSLLPRASSPSSERGSLGRLAPRAFRASAKSERSSSSAGALSDMVAPTASRSALSQGAHGGIQQTDVPLGKFQAGVGGELACSRPHGIDRAGVEKR